MKSIMEVSIHNKLLSIFEPPENWQNPKGHISALIKGGKIIVYGENNMGGVPNVCASRGLSCHSEMQVIKYLNSNNRRKNRKYIMWNVRWSKKGTIECSKPCYNCQQAMLNMGITTVVFSTDKGTFEKCKLESLNCKHNYT